VTERHLYSGQAMIPFKQLPQEDQIKFAASSGKGMKPDTVMLIYKLDDQQLYTLSDMAATFYRKGTGQHHNMTKRLHSFLAYREVQPDVVGNEGTCWYGASVKDCLEGRYYYLAELRCQLLRTMSHISKRSGEQSQRVVGPQITEPVVEEPDPNLEKREKKAPAILWAAMVAAVLTAFISIYFTRKPLEVEEGKQTIAVLPCFQSTLGTLMQEMVSKGLNDSHSFSALPANRIELLTGRLNVCEEPSNTVIQKMFDDLDTHFLLWGKTEESQDSYTWSGALLSRNGQHRLVKVKGSSFRSLADGVVLRCLKTIGSDETPNTAIDLYSANANASFLYSEAIVHYQNGDIRAALGNFKRAGSTFDPKFYMARNMWARCMEINGDLIGARTVLESIQEQGRSGEVPQQVLIQAYKYLAFVYHDNHEVANLQELLEEVAQMNMPEEDRLYFDFRKAWLLMKYDPDQALDLANRSLAAAKKPAVQIDALWNVASIVAETDRDRATQMLNQAQALAEEHKVFNRLIDILCEKARILTRFGTTEEVLTQIPVLEKAKTFEGETGSVWDRVKIRYWLGVCYGKTGDLEKEMLLLYDVALEAQQVGIVEYEIKSRVVLVNRMLDQNNFMEAKRLLNTISNRRLAPKYRLLVLNMGVHLKIKMEEYEEALTWFTELEELGREIEDPSSLAIILNDKGWAFYKTGRYEEAESLYRESLILRQEHNLSQEVTLKNLILLHQITGHEQNVKYYQEQLSDLE